MSSNFFEIGGDSLYAIKLSLQINNSFGIELSVNEIFESSSISDIATTISNACKNLSTHKDKIKKVEDLVCFSKSVNSGKTYEGKTVMLLSNIDIKDSNSFCAPLIKEAIEDTKQEKIHCIYLWGKKLQFCQDSEAIAIWPDILNKN